MRLGCCLHKCVSIFLSQRQGKYYTRVQYLTILPSHLGMGDTLILSYIVILRAHDNRIMVILQLLSYCLHIISGAFA